MEKNLYIDASHPNEIRVVLKSNGNIEDYEYEGIKNTLIKHSAIFNMILLGFRYLSSSIPLIVFAGVAVGVGLIFSFLLQSMARNPLISNSLIR